MRDKVQSFLPQYSFATPVIAGYCDAGTMYANIPAPFHPALATLFACLSSLNAFPKFNPFSILLIFKLLNLFTILDSSGLF
jgi:hypothetical protein